MNYKRILLFILIIIVITTVTIQVNSDKPNNDRDSTEVSLVKAYEIGFSFAQKKDSSANLLFMNSVDDGINSGFDGKKGSWNLMFALPNKGERILIIIENGKIKDSQIIDKLNKRESIERGEISLNSNIAAMEAINEYALKPGKVENFFNGYHFKLEKEDNNVFLAVVGFNKENNLTNIYFNAKTGEYFGGSTRGKGGESISDVSLYK